jgi:hypothetical protein
MIQQAIRNCTMLFLLLLVVNGVVAQRASIHGRVFDAASNEGLPFVNVVVSGTTTGTVTDEAGSYHLTGLEPGFIRLEVSFRDISKVIQSFAGVQSTPSFRNDIWNCLFCLRSIILQF